VILRGDEMAELPTDAVNSRYRPVAVTRESPLSGGGDDGGYASWRRYSGSFIFLRNVL
jgi:hypothetical protein